MGSSYSCDPDQDSPSTPGMLSVGTSDLQVPHEDLIDGIQEILRSPVHPDMESVLKDTELKEEGPNCFTCKVILDGKKLDEAGYGNGKGTDRVFSWTKVLFNPDESLFTADIYLKDALGEWITDASDSEVVVRAFLKVLRDPVRVEYWWLKEGERLHGQTQADILKVLLDGAIAIGQRRTVRCTPDLDSLLDSGKKSVISDALDDHLTFDQLFQAMTDFSAQFPGAEVHEVSEHEVSVTPPSGEPGTGLSITFDKEKGEICIVNKAGGKVQHKDWVILHRSPLRLEVWKEDGDGTRRAGKLQAKQLEIALDEIIRRASSWF